jgi:selenocysteine lyase/cysteine desulfurase
MTPEEFRDLFPALRSTVWLDTPGSPPGAGPVVDALRDTVSAWSSGEFDWRTWDCAAEDARQLFARFIGVEPGTVSAVGSLAEASATVAGSLPRGRVVVAEDDFRSNLFPWLARHDVVAVPADRLADALDEDTALLAVSEVTTKDGRRRDLRALRAATDAVGARLFVNLTQSLGALRFDPLIRPDYLAVHGYKWLLCPRGAAWLVTRPDRVGELAPLAPNWKSTPPPHGYFGGPMHLADDAARCDASPAWFSWVGACAALRLIGSLDPARVEEHCLGLARCFAEGAQALGFRLAAEPSHIVVLYARQPDRVASRWAEHGVRATAGPDRVRFGFHYFNAEADVTTALTALRAAR